MRVSGGRSVLPAGRPLAFLMGFVNGVIKAVRRPWCKCSLGPFNFEELQ